MAVNIYSAGIVTAYGAAKSAGYTGTYEDFCRQQAQYAEAAAAVEQAKGVAVQSATEAAGSASTATTKATEAAESATSANTSKNAAAGSASAAATSATNAAESETAAATSAAGAAESAQAAQDAQTAAEQTAEQLTESLEQIEQNTQDINTLDGDVTDLKSAKVNKPTSSPNGTPGQLLRTNGDGTTTWVDYGLPSDAQTNIAVSAWLNEHPEATTTVQDHSLTYQKLVNGTLNFITPEMFGAKGDGVTDDYSALQEMLDHGGLIVFSKNKNYRISLNSFISKTGANNKYGLQIHSNTTILGNNSIISVDTATLNNAHVFLCTDNYLNPVYDASATEVTNISINDLIIDGNISNMENEKSMTGIAIYKGTNCALHNVKMLNLCGTDGGGYGVIFAFCNMCVFENSYVGISSRSNIYCWETTNLVCRNLVLMGSVYRDCITCSTNVPIAYSESDMIIKDSILSHQYATGTHILRTAGVARCFIDNCKLSGNSAIDGISALSSSGSSVRVTVNNSQISNCSNGFNADGSGGTYTEFNLNCSTFEGQKSIFAGTNNKLRITNCKFISLDNTQAINIYSEDGILDGNIFDTYNSFIISNRGTFVISNNIFKNGVNAYGIFVSNGYTIAHGNTCEKPLRFYGNGKAYCNNAKVSDSPNLDYDQGNNT